MPAAAKRANVNAAANGAWTLASDSGGLIDAAVVQNIGTTPIMLGFTADAATPPASTAGLTILPGEGVPKDAIANLQVAGATFAVWFRSIRGGAASIFIDHAAGS